jgi:hypothetical protein
VDGGGGVQLLVRAGSLRRLGPGHEVTKGASSRSPLCRKGRGRRVSVLTRPQPARMLQSEMKRRRDVAGLQAGGGRVRAAGRFVAATPLRGSAQ